MVGVALIDRATCGLGVWGHRIWGVLLAIN